MIIRGKLIAETPIYRGNARKTLFTRDSDGTQRLVSLAGEISGTAQALMDAFIGQSRDGRNMGLLNRAWRRLYGDPLPDGLITRVECRLPEAMYTQDRFFDLRMGLKLDEDRWAAEANANYKMETVFRHTGFDFSMMVNDAVLERGENRVRLYALLEEMAAGRFWFGAGKSKGLGRLRLEADLRSLTPAAPAFRPEVNHLKIVLRFNADNPVLVGWNWGKVDPAVPAFAAIEGRLLIAAMRDIPDPIRQRLELVIGGPILSPEDWKRRLAEYLPRAIALWLQERSSSQSEVWILHENALARLAKGKYPLSQKALDAVKPLCEQPFPDAAAAEAALRERIGNQAKRVLEIMERQQQAGHQLDMAAWHEVSDSLGLDATPVETLAAQLDDETALTQTLAEACRPVMARLYQQVDQQVDLLRSDAWVDAEIANREVHLKIKQMLLEGKISEAQWMNRNQPPAGISPAAWRSFLEEHSRVRYQHIIHPANLRKSITNDRNFIAFLQSYRAKARQELSQPYHVDFRSGGPFNRDVARKYGKPYDTMFMRMLTWSPAAREGAWEIYIPGSTIKGAFRKRASQVLKTLWGESPRVTEILDYLFGRQGQRGAIYFSDAYLTDPTQPEEVWCSMDGVRMDPATARPVETAKHDYLFAYGDQLNFQLQLELQDLTERDRPALAVLINLLKDFQQGDIVLGGEKTVGFGWVKARVSEITWLTADPANKLLADILPERPLTRVGPWHQLTLRDEEAAEVMWRAPLPAATRVEVRPPRAREGFISHRAFGGYSGILAVEVEVLTPLHVRESGEPSRRAVLADGNVNGWDCFSFAPAEAALRPDARLYALPSRSLKGLLRHIYAVASDAKGESPALDRLNPADSLFGWVGAGPNQAIMGRLAFGFAPFDETPELAWFKVPYPYGGWICENGVWRQSTTKTVPMFQIDKTWRLFFHAPLAPIVKRLEDFTPDTVQASYTRAILPGAKARFDIRFWNLEQEELQRLIWCIELEEGLAHKLGHHRYVGFGSVRLRILPESVLWDWTKRYTDQDEGRLPLRVAEWFEPKVVAHRAALLKALDARVLSGNR